MTRPGLLVTVNRVVMVRFSEFLGWVHRPPATNGEQCRANWEQDGWSFWCGLAPNHPGPHQEVGYSDGERPYVVLWGQPQN